MKDNLVNGVYVLLTNANNVAVFLVQFRVIQKLLSTTRQECKVKLAQFANKWPRILNKRVPGRNSVEKDGSGES